MTIQYRVAKDVAGLAGLPAYFSDINYSVKTAANTEATVNVPSSAPMGALPSYAKNKFLAEFVVIPTTADVWVALNNTATVPAGSTFAATNSELLPAFPSTKIVEEGDVLHFISSAANANVSVKFYAINGD